jgi:peroxidase
VSEANEQRTFRPLDGVGTNESHPTWGSAGSLLARGAEGAAYADGMRRPIDRGNERTISRRFHALDDVLTPRAPSRLNMWAVLVGQFLNHDLEDNHFFGHWEDNNKSFATPDSPYQFVWVLDADDPIATFRNNNRVANGEPCGIPFKPSVGGFVDGVFAPGNRSTSYLDLAHVYGAEPAIAHALRAYSGGRLKTEDYSGTSTYRTELGPVKVDYEVGNLPPSRETTGLHVDTSFTRLVPAEVCTGGDARTSENMGLLQVQVLFLREHNWRADRLGAAHPDWDDERVFQEARRWTIAVWQHVLVDEWMVALCGAEASDRLGTYTGYDDDVDVTTALVFATNALRCGHSMLHPYIPREANGTMSTHRVSEAMPLDGSLPNVGQVNNGISPMAHYSIAGGSPEHIVRGMLATAAQEAGLVYNSAIHDIAFVSGGTDLMTLDLARGRDNGIPPYHVLRTIYGGFVNDGDWAAEADVISEAEKRAMIDRGQRLERRTALTNFLRFAARDPANPSDDEVAIATRIQDIYRRADSVDPMVGLLAEPHVEDSCVGRTFQNILIDQIERCSAGDRFWYENNQFDADDLREIRDTSMRDLLLRHFDLTNVSDRAFLTVESQEKGAAA